MIASGNWGTEYVTWKGYFYCYYKEVKQGRNIFGFNVDLFKKATEILDPRQLLLNLNNDQHLSNEKKEEMKEFLNSCKIE